MSETRQRFVQHLEALRNTLVGMAVGWLLGALVVTFNFSEVLRLLKLPLEGTHQAQLITLSPLTGIFIGFNIVTVGGAIVGAPLMILYALKFLSPALRPHEQRLLGMVGALAAALFIAGVIFGFAWLLPLSLQIALALQNAMGFQLLWSAQEYFSFVVTLPLIMGAAFCIPLIIGVLVRLRVLDHNALSKRWDVATLIILILAAAITPTGDPVSFLFIAIPLGLLYALALIFGRPPRSRAARFSGRAGSR